MPKCIHQRYRFIFYNMLDSIMTFNFEKIDRRGHFFRKCDLRGHR